MKKLALSLILIFTCCILFVACDSSNVPDNTDSNNTTSNHNLNQELLDSATTANSFDSVYKILDQDHSPAMQIALAHIDNVTVKETLLHYPNLDSEALVTLCQNTGSFDLNSNQIFDLYLNKIAYSNLTPEQEVRIALTQKEPMQMGLLYRGSSLSPEALMILCESPGNLDPNNSNISGFYSNIIKSIKLAPEQELRILNTREENFIIALLQREKLSSQCLIEFCKDSKGLDLHQENIEQLLISAIIRTPLSEEEKLELSGIDNSTIQASLKQK